MIGRYCSDCMQKSAIRFLVVLVVLSVSYLIRDSGKPAISVSNKNTAGHNGSLLTFFYSCFS